MFTSPYPIELARGDRAELEAMVRSRTLSAALVRRAQLILALAEDTPYAALRERFDLSAPTIARWRKRFLQRGVAGLHDRPRSGRGDRVAPALEAKILALTQQPPPKLYTHWTMRRLAVRLGISHMTVHRVWQRAGLNPLEYVCHGTLSLYAALEVGSGHVEGMTAPRHTTQAFLTFLGRVVASQPKRRKIHIICDNLSAHKTQAVKTWLAAHPRVGLHYTPTYASWLNQVELWFAKIQPDLIARSIFTSLPDPRRKLMHYIRAYNKSCDHFVWTYRNVKRRIRANANPVTVHSCRPQHHSRRRGCGASRRRTSTGGECDSPTQAIRGTGRTNPERACPRRIDVDYRDLHFQVYDDWRSTAGVGKDYPISLLDELRSVIRECGPWVFLEMHCLSALQLLQDPGGERLEGVELVAQSRMEQPRTHVQKHVDEERSGVGGYRQAHPR